MGRVEKYSRPQKLHTWKVIVGEKRLERWSWKKNGHFLLQILFNRFEQGQNAKICYIQGFLLFWDTTAQTQWSDKGGNVATHTSENLGILFQLHRKNRKKLAGHMAYFRTTQWQMERNLNFQARSHASFAETVTKIESVGLNNDVIVYSMGTWLPNKKKLLKSMIKSVFRNW